MIPIHLNPRLAKSIELICKNALAYGGNHPEVRKAISNLVLLLELESSQPCVEAVTLRNLLKRTEIDYESRPAVSLDPVHELSLGSNPKISPDQQAAAFTIQKVWKCFSRYLSVQAKNLESSGLGKGRRLDAIDAMSAELAYVYEHQYQPWYKAAAKTYIKRTGINEGEVVLKVVLESVFPEMLDKRFSLPSGSALAALQNQLDLFNEYA